jgi:hypothetical protein
MLGITESDVSKIVGLSDLEPEIKTAISDNRISFDTAQEIKRIPPDKGRVEHAEVIAHQKMNRDEARDYVKHTVLSLCDNCVTEDENKALELINEKWYCRKCAPKFRPKVEPKSDDEPKPQSGKQVQEQLGDEPVRQAPVQYHCIYGNHNMHPDEIATTVTCRTHVKVAGLLFKWFEEQTQYDAYAISPDMLEKMKVVPKK